MDVSEWNEEKILCVKNFVSRCRADGIADAAESAAAPNISNKSAISRGVTVSSSVIPTLSSEILRRLIPREIALFRISFASSCETTKVSNTSP